MKARAKKKIPWYWITRYDSHWWCGRKLGWLEQENIPKGIEYGNTYHPTTKKSAFQMMAALQQQDVPASLYYRDKYCGEPCDLVWLTTAEKNRRAEMTNHITPEMIPEYLHDALYKAAAAYCNGFGTEPYLSPDGSKSPLGWAIKAVAANLDISTYAAHKVLEEFDDRFIVKKPFQHPEGAFVVA